MHWGPLKSAEKPHPWAVDHEPWVRGGGGGGLGVGGGRVHAGWGWGLGWGWSRGHIKDQPWQPCRSRACTGAFKVS